MARCSRTNFNRGRPISRITATVGPAWPRLGKLVYRLALPLYRRRFAAGDVHEPGSPFAQSRVEALRRKLARGETGWLVGIGPAGHNSGVALVEVSPHSGPRLVSNDEEERFAGIKHAAHYPAKAVEVLRGRLDERGLTAHDIDAVLATWDYVSLVPFALRAVAEHFPASLPLALPSCMQKWDFYNNGPIVKKATHLLARQLGARAPMPIICQRHHDNHAAASWALSPFARDGRPALITVLDGFGDEGSISVYLAREGRLECLSKNHSFFDSLGVFYSILSSTQGGWTTLSSEGRYMGAVAWGDSDRLTNRFYRSLREIFHLGPGGEVKINRSFVNWHKAGEQMPYGAPMRQLLGDPIPLEKMWNPDAVLRVETIEHSEITRERCDVAAATQLVYEDVLFHLVDHFIRATGCDRLVMTGGTALNCLANMRLLERYDRAWYERNLGLPTRLHLWVPPFPGDAGVPVGAAYNFALQAGARPREPMRHAFYCGRGFSRRDIEAALADFPEVESRPVGHVRSPAALEAAADLAARIVARDGVLALFQGAAETGPRALGHRSILANPCNPNTPATINQRVKYREPVRPLAPMVTREAAIRFFELSEGAGDDDFNAYNYMVLTAPARPEAYARIPAVIHKDGTARLQIVRREHDPFTHAYLRAMGRHAGVEASVNTSLNVGSPIVQTPAQALGALQRARGLSGLLFIADDGDVLLAWHNVEAAPKDSGRQIRAWLAEWGERHAASQAVTA